jgi:hypothetical protein
MRLPQRHCDAVPPKKQGIVLPAMLPVDVSGQYFPLEFAATSDQNAA